MQYTECIHYLEKEVGFASCPGLERIQVLCDELGSPEQKLPVIHVAGTNGKGSAVSMLSAILQEAGYRIGTYTSPHLERYNERICINGKPISDADFAEKITYIKKICERFTTEGKAVPTLFEIITAAAFLYFAEQNIDVLILEVGLGGKYDATNVILSPLLSLIMSISIDHTDFLGNTLEEIAAEKAGIIKKNCPVVLYSQDKLVYNIVEKVALSLNAPLSCPNDTDFQIHSQTLEKTVFSVRNPRFQFQDLELSLLGSHQVSNCITVLEACMVLQKKGFSLSENHIRNGLKKVHWAGRMEICRKNPLVILDGAHNADGILHLANSLSVYFKEKKVTLVLGVLGDKEYDKMAKDILPFANSVILTEPHSERKLDVFTLSRSVSNFNGTIYMEKEVEHAYQKALSITPEDGIILCCGSLYMIGAVRMHIISEKYI